MKNSDGQHTQLPGVPLKLKDQVAIVTGAAHGIGAASAIELAGAGANVVIYDILDRSEASNTLKSIELLNRKVLFVQGDVANRVDDQRLMEEALQTFGRVDILVNNAGYSVRKPLLDLDTEDVRRTWDVTLWGVFYCSQLAAREMVKLGTGGSIVTISSVHASRPYPNSSPYNAAKAAVNHMSATWAKELAPHRIRVNVIEPGWIDTPGERAHFSQQSIQKQADTLPFQRLGTPQEIAKAVLFLASSEDSSYVTGSCLRVDGGFVLQR